MKAKLVPATENDRFFFRQAHHLAYRAVIEVMFGWDEVQQDKAADKDFDERNPHIICQNDVHVGVVGWQDQINHIWFGPIFILPDYQNKGIGTELIEYFMIMAGEQSKALKLQTLKENLRAKELYERMGFKVIASDEIHWQLEYSPQT